MFFEFHIAVPKNTTANEPQVTEVKLKQGIIHFVEFIPWGHAIDILRCRVERGLHSIFPTDGSDYISFCGQPVTGRVHQVIDGAPYSLKVIAWNLSTVYEHSFTIRLWMLAEELVEPAAGVFDRFLKWLTGMLKPKE